MTAQKKMTEKEVRTHIKKNMDKWLFVGHVADLHINATEEELQARLGKYSDEGRLISRASSFLDMAGGDDIVNGLVAALQAYSAEILQWIHCSKDEVLTLYFDGFPEGVSGITCSISNQNISQSDGYIVLLCKNEQYPFYLLNTYPV